MTVKKSVVPEVRKSKFDADLAVIAKRLMKIIHQVQLVSLLNFVLYKLLNL